MHDFNRHNKVESVQRLSNALCNISKSLSLLGNSVNPIIIANLRETKEQLDADINMLSKEVDEDSTS